MIPRRKPLSANIGIYGVGHHTYWSQFPGLLEEMQNKLSTFDTQAGKHDVKIVNFGISDCAQTAYAAVPQIKAADPDLLFVVMLTYATSGTIGVIFRELDIPIVLVALQPAKALDYDKATTYMQLLNDDICSLPEFTGVALRMGKRIPPMVIGMRKLL